MQCEYSQACTHLLAGSWPLQGYRSTARSCLHPATGCAWGFLSSHLVADMLPGLFPLHAQFEGEGKITLLVSTVRGTLVRWQRWHATTPKMCTKQR
jgi:hypothetical protein